MATTVDPYVVLGLVAIVCTTLVALVQSAGNTQSLQDLAKVIIEVFRNLRW